MGAQVRCDTAADVKALLAETAPRPNSSPSPGDGEQADDNEFAAVAATLSKTQLSFLELLANAGETSDAQARASLRLEGNKVLAGLLGAIHKRFKKARLPYPVQTEKRFVGGVRSYRYSLSEADVRTVKTISEGRD